MNRTNRMKPVLLACAAGIALMAAQPAAAQQVDSTRLLELMVTKGLVTREEADALLAEATVAPTPAPLPPVPAGGVDAQGVQTIPYIPQVVRDQLRDELRAELGTQAQAEGWARPGEVPEWTRRIQVYGDVRLRGEGRFFDDGNADIFTDYGAINAGDPQNLNDLTPGYVAPPFLNTLENRQRLQLRARLGVKAQIADWISADIRLATGSDRSPVSTNQTLGANGGSGYEIWLDRAAIRLTPVEGVAVDFGRFANPFWTGDLIYDADLNFDGLAYSANAPMGDNLTLFAAAGAFPVFNTSLNFGSRNAPMGSASTGPYESQDRYLIGSQVGADIQASETIRLKAAVGYFHYDNVEGQLSAPCNFDEVVCSTDATRPAFQQHGNTLFPIRNILADPANPTASPENQYFGLASQFEILHLRAAMEYRPSARFGLRLDGEFVKNLGWDEDVLAVRAVNNLGPDILVPNPATPDPNDTMPAPGPYDGGDTGWQLKVNLGSMLDLGEGSAWVAQRGDWSTMIGYRHLESDAVMDAFADSDFHIGGTNAKGWFIGGHYAIGPNTLLSGRWISTDEIADAPFSVDRLFVDLSTRF
ncbi:putative porin [Brevundimonas sp. GCM10030266]|uniref:putative porin n=1 Tax=Brevundimonas sp. GCM10030266 TaxID=3273386 RepID=UPI0036153EB4